MIEQLFWFQIAVCSIQIFILILSYGLLRLIQSYIKDFGYKTGLDKS